MKAVLHLTEPDPFPSLIFNQVLVLFTLLQRVAE